MPVVSASTPSDCFNAVYEAVRIAVQHMTPVIFLSDGYIANGAEPWKCPKRADLAPNEVKFKTELGPDEEKFQPYGRDEKLVRPGAIAGTPGLEHRIGGLEKQNVTGNVSYDPENHQVMVRIREEKIARIADHIPPQHLDSGPDKGDLLVLGWGSTYGSIKSAVSELQREGYAVAHAHLRHLRPFPANLRELLRNYMERLISEPNNGQLIRIIRDQFFIDAKGYHKIMGIPITKTELVMKIREMLH